VKKSLFDKEMLIDDITENNFFTIFIYASLGLVSFFMTILNIITDKGYLTIATGIFVVLCAINIALSFLGNIGKFIAKVLFALEFLALLTFFLVSGNPDGFSAIWICLLPSTSMYFFNKRRATVVCVAMLGVLIFFLYTDVGNGFLQYQYNDTFKMRFPILFVAFYVLAFFLESRREKAYAEMRRMQNYYRELSNHDPLTQILNRQGMYAKISADDELKRAKRLYAVMFDIDDFKKTNDLYGHDAGDVVLKEFANILKDEADGVICRWGGEEFVAIFSDENFSAKVIENIKENFANYSFIHNDTKFNVTVSIGVSCQDNFDIDDIDKLIANADEAMYNSKKSGKNRITYFN